MKVLKAIEVTTENFKEMGQVISIPNPAKDIPKLQGEGFNHYAELAFLDCEGPVEFGITMFNKRDTTVIELEQHAGTQEMLLALDGPFIMPVAPMIEVDGKQVIDENKLFAIKVSQGQGVIFKQGFWHYAPFPLKEQSSVLVGFKPLSWKDDIIMCSLSEPISIQMD